MSIMSLGNILTSHTDVIQGNTTSASVLLQDGLTSFGRADANVHKSTATRAEETPVMLIVIVEGVW